MCEPGKKCADRTPQELLDHFADSPGYGQIAELIQNKFGVPAAEIKPYLVAVGTETSAVTFDGTLQSILEAGAEKGTVGVMYALTSQVSKIPRLRKVAELAEKAIGLDVFREAQKRAKHFEPSGTKEQEVGASA